VRDLPLKVPSDRVSSSSRKYSVSKRVASLRGAHTQRDSRPSPEYKFVRASVGGISTIQHDDQHYEQVKNNVQKPSGKRVALKRRGKGSG
jgi:hypothetical protein